MLRPKTISISKVGLLLLTILGLNVACVSVGQEQAATPVIHLGMVIHLEGWPLHEGEQVLERYEGIVLDYADLFEQHGAKLTLETINTVDAILQYDGRHNFLAELEARGHAVGVHADLGGRPGLTYPNFVATLQQMKQNHESLGLSPRHVSGICSYLDWVSAAVDAGFEAASSGVAYCYSSMPEEDRPEAYRNCPNPADCHEYAPDPLAARLHPWRTQDGSDWLNRVPNGPLMLIPSSGTINCFSENRASSGSFTSCEFEQNDIDRFVNELNRAFEIARPNAVNTYYVVWSLGSRLDAALLDRWLSEVDVFVQSGQVVWATLHEMMDLYDAANGP